MCFQVEAGCVHREVHTDVPGCSSGSIPVRDFPHISDSVGDSLVWFTASSQRSRRRVTEDQTFQLVRGKRSGDGGSAIVQIRTLLDPERGRGRSAVLTRLGTEDTLGTVSPQDESPSACWSPVSVQPANEDEAVAPQLVVVVTGEIKTFEWCDKRNQSDCRKRTEDRGERREERGQRTEERGERREERGERTEDRGERREERGERREKRGERREERGERREERGQRREMRGERTEERGERREERGQRTEESGQRREERGQRKVDRGERTEVGGQRTEDRGERREDRGQRKEDRGQRREDKGQRTEDRGERREDRGQRKVGRGEGKRQRK
ncbi:unnamed protein product [Pleuronectes platessa]|uniref:Uncharacterized protein n=1 Tax=Pleuronectes platessa TaxID=8262 RepID=A0A9N7Z6T9_PLEPL|nr:unnamed protein product [Pleuronectes platessa]